MLLALLGSFIALGGFALGLWIIRRTERWLAAHPDR
jgi:hypothetical protein